MAVPPGSRVTRTREPGLFEARGEPQHLRRFPAAFRAFECDKRAVRHQSECETLERQLSNRRVIPSREDGEEARICNLRSGEISGAL